MKRDDPAQRPLILGEAEVDTPPTEHSRLLGSDSPSRRETENGVAAEGSREEEWEGYKDFAGLPWWRTPSVGFLL